MTRRNQRQPRMIQAIIAVVLLVLFGVLLLLPAFVPDFKVEADTKQTLFTLVTAVVFFFIGRNTDPGHAEPVVTAAHVAAAQLVAMQATQERRHEERRHQERRVGERRSGERRTTDRRTTGMGDQRGAGDEAVASAGAPPAFDPLGPSGNTDIFPDLERRQR